MRPALTVPNTRTRSPLVSRHDWQGYRCESRLVRAAAPCIAPLVLVGGAFQTKESWGRLERELLAHVDVFTVDLPGWGAGNVLPDRHGADFLADALGHMLDESGLTSVNLVGGSYGTAIVYRLAQRRPELVERMVLVGTMTSIPGHARVAMRRTLDLLVDRRMEEFAEETVAFMVNADRIDSVTAGSRVRRFLMRRMLNLSEEDVAKHLANTMRLLRHEMLDTSRPPAMPVLVATGEHDTFTTPDLCRDLAATCSDSWFTQVADADHMLPLERPVELADLITHFLADEPLEQLTYCRGVERTSQPCPAR
ncbi:MULTISPECIES: alpha/beta fold hydrolase [unclassified Streptomyces]|uniref:alpha/beta fold hydrolase n=1 Tax=unclassified Streptomyces TaxID=2593676 RepID=UPI002DD92689|nr:MULTISPECIES: alpha/beta fold hydrolase [unclassified Streptomyces]WSE01346.1 alpha/beta hydrolase [Streptomyces sp. NBC_01474]